MTQQLEAASEAPVPTARLYDRRTLLQLSQSKHVHVPEGMASFDVWYGYVLRHLPQPLAALYTTTAPAHDGRAP